VDDTAPGVESPIVPTLTRRAVLASIGAASIPWGFGRLATAQSGQRRVIRTLTGDVDPATLSGPVLFHEHLSMRFPLDATAHFTDDVAMMTEEARAAVADGLALIVDGGHPDMHRSLDALRRIARDSGLPVVASGGYYMQRSYPGELVGRPAERIADDLVADATRDRLGAFGEIGQERGTLTETERAVFRAVGLAQARTGLPVFTHNAYLGQRPGASDIPPEAALRQLDILEAAGADLGQVAIGHMCCLHDPNAQIAIVIAKRGAFVGFDRVTLAIVPDADKVVAAMALVEAGHADRLLLSSDFASPRALKKNGGPGLAQTATVFGPMLLKAGLPPATVRRILEDNPKRFLACAPRV
jgi:phosphotriesterase-related protein